MQETWVWSVVWEDSTRCRAAKPSTTTTEPAHPGVYAAWQENPPQWEAHEPQLESNSCLLQLEKVHVQQQRSSAAKNK